MIPQVFTTRDVVAVETYVTPVRAQMDHVSSLALSPDGGATFTTANGETPSFAKSDQVTAPDPNFTRYKQTIANVGDEVLDLYKAGSANSQLALTYASFGEWQVLNPWEPDIPRQQFFTYGVLTPFWALAAKSGTAQYSGFLYGTAANPQSGRYALSGSVSYDVNFSTDAYTGSMSIQGAYAFGGSKDFGSFDITGGVPLAANLGKSNPLGDFATVTQNGAVVGQISNRFFGPDGEEMAGVFNMTVVDMNMVGAAVAKRK